MKKLLIFTFVIGFLTSCATQETSMQQGQSTPVDVEGLEYPEINSYQTPEVETFELDNGIKFYLVEDKEVPLIDLNMIIKAGSFMVPDDKVGLNSVLTSAMRNGGSETYPENELNQLLEDNAARIEFGMGQNSGSVSLNVLKEDFEELLPVMIDVMMNPLIPQEKIDLAIRQQKSAIMRRNDNAQQIGFREFSKLIYGEDSVQGRTTELYTLDNITREDLVEFHQNAFTGENMMIGLVGDFDVDEIKTLLEEAFADIPAGEENEFTFNEIDYEFESSIHFINKSDVNQSVVLMGHIGGMRDNPDYAALQAMNEVLSGGFSGRLFQNVRSDQGLAYAVFGNYGSSSLYPGQFYAGLFTRSAATAEAIKSVRSEMVKLQEEPVSEQELEDTKDRIFNSLVFRNDSRSSVLYQRMNNEYFGRPADSFERYIEELREVTAADIQRVAQEYMRPDQMKILVVGNESELGDQLQEFGDVQEIDITIPQPGQEEEMIAGDTKAGRELLNEMAEAILPIGPIEGDLVFEAESEIESPQGKITLGITQTVNYREDAMTSEVSAPFGLITMKIADGQGTMMMGGNQQPMPPAQKQQLMGEYHRDHVYLAMNKDSVEVEYLGMEELEGRELARLRIIGEETYNLYLDPETSFPVVRTYSQFNPQLGEQVNLKVVASEWTETDGVMMPYRTVVYSGDEIQSTTTLSSHSVQQ